METKICFDCKETKAKTQFYKHNQKKDSLRPTCKPCTDASNSVHRLEVQRKWRANNPRSVKNMHLKKLFGLTIAQYEELLEKQNNCCACCGRHKSNFKRALAVDHCHSSRKIRGLLCMYCNTAIGSLQDNLETINKAYNYLSKHKGETNEVA